MLLKERQSLETIQALVDYFYEKTEDPWYLKLSKDIDKKLKGKND